MREISRQGEGDETPRVVLAQPRTYSIAYGGSGGLMSRHLDKLPRGQHIWVAENGLYLFSTQNEERGRIAENLRHLNDQGGRPVANIAARDIGIHSTGAPHGEDGGLLRQTYLCKGERRIATSAVLQEQGLYNAASGEGVDIVSREGGRPPESPVVFAIARSPGYRGPVYLDDGTKVGPIAPAGPLRDLRRVIPLAPDWGCCAPQEPGGALRRRARCRVRRRPPAQSVVWEIATWRAIR